MKWSWNERDSECWTHGTFDTKEEAIEDAYGCKEMIKRDGFYSDDEDPMIYIGQCEYIPLRTDLDADRELEYLDVITISMKVFQMKIRNGLNKSYPQ